MLKSEGLEKQWAIGQAAAFAAAFAGGFFLAGENTASAISFGSVCLAGAVGVIPSSAVLTGSLLRCIAEGTIGSGIVQLGAMMICVIYKVFFETALKPVRCGIVTAVSAAVSGAAVAAIMGDPLTKLLLCIIYGAAAGASAYCISSVCESTVSHRGVDLSGILGCCWGVVYMLLCGALCTAELPLINPGIAVGAAVTALAAYHFGCTGGALCGALAMCGAFFASRECGAGTAMLPVAGLITGCAVKLRPVSAAIIFTVSCFIFTVFTGGEATVLLNIIPAMAIFLAVAPKLTEKHVYIGRSHGAESAKEAMRSQMRFMAGSIETVRRESVKIAQVLADSVENGKKTEPKGGEICRRCHRRLDCWYNSSETTKRGFVKLAKLAGRSKEEFPYELEHCLHKEELAESFEKSAREKMMSRLLTMRLADSRRLIYEQMKAAEEIIEAAGSSEPMRCSERLSRIIGERLEKYGLAHERVIAGYNSRNRMLAEVYFKSGEAPKNGSRLCDIISDELDMKLEYAEPVTSGSRTRLRIYEKTPFALETYKASMCADDSSETGDSYAVFGDGTGTGYVVLSDGMGSGRAAALESRMVVSMFRRLISSGVSYSTAIRMINPIMLTKSRSEAFATLDAVRIDLDTCGLTVIKSGAAATLIRHGGQVLKVTSPTLPIGIVEEANVYARDFDFAENDIIIMFSDGISENEYLFIKELLLSSDNIKYIVDEICAKAELFSPVTRADDITVIGIRMVRSE